MRVTLKIAVIAAMTHMPIVNAKRSRASLGVMTIKSVVSFGCPDDEPD